jgi:hypothetical protein
MRNGSRATATSLAICRTLELARAAFAAAVAEKPASRFMIRHPGAGPSISPVAFRFRSNREMGRRFLAS